MRNSLQLGNVGRLRSSFALRNVETDLLAFVETAVAFTNDRGLVNEQVVTVVAADEAKPLLSIEPVRPENACRYCVATCGAMVSLLSVLADGGR